MKVIILCGGAGTRLKEETEFKPKPMVHIGNQPIIWHIMKIYSHYGFNEFILALGYKAKYIKEFFLNQKALVSDFTLDTLHYKTIYHSSNRENLDFFKVTFVDTGIDTLIGERILMCKKYIPPKDKLFMVTYGDGVANVNIKEIISFHKQKKVLGTITGIHPRSKFGLIKLEKNGFIKSFVEKPMLNDWVNGGFMVFDKKIFDYINPGEMEHEALKRIAAKNDLALYKHKGFWFAVDTYRELEELNKIWESGNAPWKIWT